MFDDLKLIPESDSRLHRICDSIPVGDPTWDEFVRELAPKMFDLMKREGGIGLAAPQVGINRRIFVMKWAGQNHVCVNPEILHADPTRVTQPEGCLSFPGIQVPVARYDVIRVTYITRTGERREGRMHGMLSRIFQHELDHLDGIVFTKTLDGRYSPRSESYEPLAV